MIFRQRRPTAALSRFIELFWFYQDLEVDHTKEKILPNGGIELIIDLSSSPKKLFNRLDFRSFDTFQKAWVSGLQRQYIVIGAERGSSMMGAHFRPGGGMPFFGFPVSELTGFVVNLDLIWKAEVHSIRDRILQESDISRKFDILENYLLVKAAGNLESDATVEASLAAFRQCPSLRLRDLAARIGVSKKELISRFECSVGCSPKLASRIMRFQQALEVIHPRAVLDWSETALRTGYYDQSHFIHEFQEFAGMTPGDYASHRTAYRDYIYLD